MRVKFRSDVLIPGQLNQFKSMLHAHNTHTHRHTHTLTHTHTHTHTHSHTPHTHTHTHTHTRTHTHTGLLKQLNDSIPTTNEVCWRTVSVTSVCLSSNCHSIPFVSRCAFNFCRIIFQWVAILLIGERYTQDATVNNVLSRCLRAKRIYYTSQVTDDFRTSIRICLELITLEDNVMFLLYSDFDMCEICDVNSFFCTSQFHSFLQVDLNHIYFAISLIIVLHKMYIGYDFS